MNLLAFFVYAPIAACALLAVYVLGGVSGLVIVGIGLLIKTLTALSTP